jgi:hypothetical protein
LKRSSVFFVEISKSTAPPARPEKAKVDVLKKSGMKK